MARRSKNEAGLTPDSLCTHLIATSSATSPGAHITWKGRRYWGKGRKGEGFQSLREVGIRQYLLCCGYNVEQLVLLCCSLLQTSWTNRLSPTLRPQNMLLQLE